MKKIILAFIISIITSASIAQNVGIGTATPSAKLHLNGSFKVTDGSQGEGKVLTSDAQGAATWQASSNTQTGGVGFGPWGDCNTRAISEYNPVAASDGSLTNFGKFVSMSGNFAIIGTDIIASQGKAYIHRFDGSTWQEQQILKASDGSALVRDNFGSSVSISGNYAIVGAYAKTVGGNSFQGKAYIYFFNGNSWVEQQILTSSDGASNDAFGTSVSINGNYAIVGSYGKTVSGKTSQGKAYIFYYNGSTWVQMGLGITAIDGAASDYFGRYVSINSDNAIVGAPNKTVGGQVSQGKAYIFHNSGGTWTQVGTGITGSSGTLNDAFGTSVSINGDFAIVGASGKTVGTNPYQGSAYIYFYNGSSWVERNVLTAPDGTASDFFGFSVCITNKYAIVGAYGKTVNGILYRGSAYIYQSINGIWQPLQQVNNPGGKFNDLFGYGVAADGNRFLIGSYGVQNYTGMAYFGKIEQ